MIMNNKIILLNGPSSVGKSTIADILSKQIERTAFFQVDTIRTYVTNGVIIQDDVEQGRAQMKQYIEQHELAIKMVLEGASLYHERGFTVIITDTVYMNELKDLYFNRLHKDIFIPFLLTARYEVLLARYKERNIKEFERDKTKAKRYFDYFSETYNENRWITLQTDTESVEESLTRVRGFIAGDKK